MSRGAELAYTSILDFKEILEDRSVKILTLVGSKEKLDEGVERLKEILERSLIKVLKKMEMNHLR
ncbi:MAG: hypothetical protein ACLFVB_09280 [Thermoplasmata archaeon]